VTVRRQKFELRGATIAGTHINLRGSLDHQTTDTGRTRWEANGVADSVPRELLSAQGETHEVVLHTDRGDLRGQASVTVAAVTRGTTVWPVRIAGTDELEGL
jgi:hypothetical protein